MCCWLQNFRRSTSPPALAPDSALHHLSRRRCGVLAAALNGTKHASDWPSVPCRHARLHGAGDASGAEVPASARNGTSGDFSPPLRRTDTPAGQRRRMRRCGSECDVRSSAFAVALQWPNRVRGRSGCSSSWERREP
jgi:hypothetical protein